MDRLVEAESRFESATSVSYLASSCRSFDYDFAFVDQYIYFYFFFYFLVTNNDRSVELFVINGDVSGLVVVVNFCGHGDVRILVLVISSGPNEVVATYLVPMLR